MSGSRARLAKNIVLCAVSLLAHVSVTVCGNRALAQSSSATKTSGSVSNMYTVQATTSPTEYSVPSVPTNVPSSLASAPTSRMTAAPDADVLSLNLSAGGSAIGGNTTSYGLQVGGDFKFVNKPHMLTANAFYTYGHARVLIPADENVPGSVDTYHFVDTAKNIVSRIKYDYFLSTYNSLFAAVGFRWDPFAGIERRNDFQVGYSRYFLTDPKHLLWSELGYSVVDTIYQPIDGNLPSQHSEVAHFARLFVGYENKLNDAVTFTGGAEGLLNLTRPEGSRLMLDAALRSALSSAFKVELKGRVLVDFQPIVEGAKRYDHLITASLLYTVI